MIAHVMTPRGTPRPIPSFADELSLEEPCIVLLEEATGTVEDGCDAPAAAAAVAGVLLPCMGLGDGL